MRVFSREIRTHLGAMATATNYEPMMSVQEARARYFSDNSFGEDGGYNDRWVIVLKLGPIPLGFPNTAGRVAAVRYHDLHHLATGYDTDILGEAEIAAWELASGCERFPAAWFLNHVALPLGVMRDAERVRRAFVRGCRTRNLYSEPSVEPLLGEQLVTLRERLGMNGASEKPMTAEERGRFRQALVIAFAFGTLLLATLIGLMAGLVFLLGWLF
jgi:hypothetical protein